MFEQNSAVRRRVIEYGKLTDELHIIVLSQRSKSIGQNYSGTAENYRQSRSNSKIKISENTFAYPTGSRNRWLYVADAIRIGKKIAQNSKFKIQNSNSDVLVTAQDPFESGLAGWRIARKCGAKLQLQVHTDLLSPFFKKESLLNRMRVMIAGFLLPKADCVRVVSARIKDSLIAGYRLPVTKVSVLPVFVDVERIQHAPHAVDLHKAYPQFNFLVLMTSRLTQEKNIPLALRAFQRVVRQHPKAGLVIAGDGPDKHTLGALVSRLGLQSNVVFEGWQPDLISHYKTADLFLLTSRYEGYGMALVEAAAAGCPIVTTDVGVVGAVINTENALVCAVEDETCIARSIRRVIENRGLRERLKTSVQAAVSTVSGHTQESYLDAYQRSWEQCGE